MIRRLKAAILRWAVDFKCVQRAVLEAQEFTVIIPGAGPVLMMSVQYAKDFQEYLGSPLEGGPVQVYFSPTNLAERDL